MWQPRILRPVPSGLVLAGGSGAVDPGLAIINERATGFFVIDQDAQLYANKVPGSSDFMQRGSTTGVDTNDPAVYVSSGEGGVYLPGADNSFMSVPYDPKFNVSGDLDIRCKVNLESYTPSNRYTLVSRYGGTQHSYLLDMAPGGSLRVIWSEDGTGVISQVSGVSVSSQVADGQTCWIRVTVAMDTSPGTLTRFYTSTDGVAWSQLGGDVIRGVSSSSFSGTNGINLGVIVASQNPLRGFILAAEVYDGIDGTLVFGTDIETDNNAGSQYSFTATSGDVVTINRGTSGYKSVYVPAGGVLAQGDGVDDYLELPTSCTPSYTESSGEYTVIAVTRSTNFPGGGARIFSAEAAPDSSAEIRVVNAGNYAVRAGPGPNRNVSNDPVADGEMRAVSLVVSDGAFNGYVDGVLLTEADANIISAPSHATPTSLSRGGVAFFADVDIHSLAVFHTRLTQPEVLQVSTYMKGLVA